jgi:hypothetical protein
LWYDLTQGIGAKWKTFFVDLEMGCGLRVDLDSHIWLLHHLFLHELNQEIWEWGETWNAHKLRIRNERQTSPHDLFSYGVFTHGLYSPFPETDPLDNVATLDEALEYGIDWADWEEPMLRRHHIGANGLTEADDDGEAYDANPVRGVEVPDAHCPLDIDNRQELEMHLSQIFGLDWQRCRNLHHQEHIWLEALVFCQNISDQFG